MAATSAGDREAESQGPENVPDRVIAAGASESLRLGISAQLAPAMKAFAEMQRSQLQGLAIAAGKWRISSSGSLRPSSLPGRGQGRSSSRALHLVPVRGGW